ncbi:MAG TPA: sugar ABC transporter substrate-binding protein, partial [Kaistia sp.]|nr:sugar ABC transporter substrate-binding protein [Kaistia sp.]
MKTQDYEQHSKWLASRRGILKGAAGLGALAATGALGMGGASLFAQPAMAQAGDLRAQLLAVPGVGKGSPTDADWQKVGEMVLDATKKNVKEGEFAGVELTFMGLNNQNLHNMLFRGFLKPWEAYTGAKI